MPACSVPQAGRFGKSGGGPKLWHPGRRRTTRAGGNCDPLTRPATAGVG